MEYCDELQEDEMDRLCSMHGEKGTLSARFCNDNILLLLRRMYLLREAEVRGVRFASCACVFVGSQTASCVALISDICRFSWLSLAIVA